VEHIEKAKELKVPMSRGKPEIEGVETAPIMAILQQQATPEQVRAYEI
jgi:hypothetical protein